MKKIYQAAFLLAALAAAAGSVSAAAVWEQKAVLGGTVLSVLPVGTAVKEGETLVTVDTMAGAVPAAKASADGIVKEVRVQMGSDVKSQDVLVVLESK